MIRRYQPDSTLAALLEQIRARPKAPQPNGEMLELARGLSSTPLAFFAEALATHLWNLNFGEFEVTAESLEENGFHDEIVEALRSLGLADSEGICIGNDGGGAEALLMVADSNKPGGYTICRFAYDGVPYSGGEPIEALGQLTHLLQALMLSSEIDVQLQNLPGVNPKHSNQGIHNEMD